jgi:hypothetical protein
MRLLLLSIGALRAFVLIAFGVGPSRHVRNSADACDVRGIFQSLDLPTGSIALSTGGDVQDIDQVLAPSKLGEGTYAVTVTRKGSNVYRVDVTSTYIVTRYCYHYGYSDKATLRWTSTGTFGVGKLEFQ